MTGLVLCLEISHELSPVAYEKGVESEEGLLYKMTNYVASSL